MIDQIKRLVKVDEKLGQADNRICKGMSLAAATSLDSEDKVAVQEYRDARQILQLTIEQMRKEWAKIARSDQAAIELLTELRDDWSDITKPSVEPMLIIQEKDRITKVIGWLDGSLPMGEGDE